MSIHQTAIVHPDARIGKDVAIGPYAVIGGHVEIGDRTTIGPHTVIEGDTEIGEDNRIFQFASIGAAPQDLKFSGERTSLRIGDRNVVREFVTLHCGTVGGGGVTTIGNDNLFMAYCHVAHDCHLGDHIVMANSATLAGHVTIGDYAILSALIAVHQFTRVGAHVMISGGSMVNQDVPPFTIAQGDRARTVGLNLVGLKRRGFDEKAISGIKKAYRLLFRSGLRLETAVEQIIDEVGDVPQVVEFVEFVKGSQRGIAR